jgi:hypothetical protein
MHTFLCSRLVTMKIKIIKTEQEKNECLDACSQEGLALLFSYDEDPKDMLENPDSVQRIEANKYLVSPPYSFEKLNPWLRYGNWQAVYPENTNYGSINIFKSSQEEIEEFMNAHSIDVIIDSFYDDTEWKVAWNDGE